MDRYVAYGAEEEEEQQRGAALSKELRSLRKGQLRQVGNTSHNLMYEAAVVS